MMIMIIVITNSSNNNNNNNPPMRTPRGHPQCTTQMHTAPDAAAKMVETDTGAHPDNPLSLYPVACSAACPVWHASASTWVLHLFACSAACPVWHASASTWVLHLFADWLYPIEVLLHAPQHARYGTHLRARGSSICLRDCWSRAGLHSC